MENKGLLIVSFGTSYREAFEQDILPAEQAIAAAFPGYSVYRAFGSRMIIRKLQSRDGVNVDTVTQALEKMMQAGIREAVIQPTFVICGTEYDRMMAEVTALQDRFDSLRVGKPLLSAPEDFDALADGLGKHFPKEDGSVVLMGHGTEHSANAAYETLEKVLCKSGCNHIRIGTVEGTPDIEDVRKALRAEAIREVTLAPLMLVAGDHARNDMASDEPDSWKSQLACDGVETRCIVSGLGSLPFIGKMFADHACKAVVLR